MKKKVLLISFLMWGVVAFAGGDLNLSSDIPVCGTKIVEKYQKDSQNEVRGLIDKISENEKLMEIEYNKSDKNWEKIQILTKKGGELKGELEYIVLSRN